MHSLAMHRAGDRAGDLRPMASWRPLWNVTLPGVVITLRMEHFTLPTSSHPYAYRSETLYLEPTGSRICIPLLSARWYADH